MKPANTKARALLAKLQALAERGVGGEKENAKRKLARLKAAFDFTAPDRAATLDLFADFKFRPGKTAAQIASFPGTETDIANSVKWAIENATGIRCAWRGANLLAEAAPGTANRLAGIAVHIAGSFRELLAKFSAVDGVRPTDRGAFVRGLYDGMMNDTRRNGERLPGRITGVKVRKSAKAKNLAVAGAPGLKIHPYSLGLGLGRQVRFSVPLDKIAAELQEQVQRQLTA